MVNIQNLESATFEEFLFQLSFSDLDLYSLIHLLGMSTLVIRVGLDGCREESVDESRLSEARLASNLQEKTVNSLLTRLGVFNSVDMYHDGESRSTLCDNLVSLIWQIGNANRRRTLNSWGHYSALFLLQA